MPREARLEEMLQIFLEREQAVTEEYLIRMGEQIREIGELIPSSVNRLVQMQRMRANLDAAKREIARLAEIGADDLEKILIAAAQASADFAAERFNNAARVPIEQNAALQEMLLAQYRVTMGEMQNLSQTTIRSESYRRALDRAIQAVQSGMEDYNAATRRALADAAGEGLRVRYPGGRTKNLYSAVRQNLLDGVRSLNNDVLKQAGEQFGANGVEISAHALCAEDHLPYQGRQFYNAEFERLQRRLARPFGMWNCKHSMHPIIVGISEPAYSEEELSAYERNSREEVEIGDQARTRYEWTQEQRRIETAVRQQKQIAIAARAAGNDRLRRDCQRNIDALNRRYDQISEAAGLSPQREQMRVAGFQAMKLREDATKLRQNVAKAGAAVSVRNTGRAVYFNENASYSVRIDGYSEDVNNGLSEAIRSVAKKGSETGAEHMHLVDLKTGEVCFYETNNVPNSVGFKFRDYIKEHPNNSFAFVHNHNIDSSFSETDIRTLVTMEQIHIMIAARNDGIIYVAEREGDCLKSANFDILYEDDLKDLNEACRNGKITPSRRTKERERIIVENLLRDFVKGGGLMEYAD